MTNIPTMDFIMGILATITRTFSGLYTTLSGSYGDFILQTNEAIDDPAVSAFLDLVKLISDAMSLSDLSVISMMIGTGIVTYIILQTIGWLINIIPGA